MLGTKLRAARLAAGLTQEDLASRTNLTREYVSLLELDKRTPTIYVFLRVARALALAPGKLLEELETSLPAGRTAAPAKRKR